MSDLEFHRRLSALERRLSKLEDGYKELDNVVDPKGWIGEAFELLERDIDEVKQKLNEVDGKIDVILQHLTGMNKS
ncbi:hypothetical protein VB715_12035 [Crocosphaera sp. UHCC 0190]|uniref:hypothetical protein n=1 Tax=Crocosphaera sp. UHCC 0190 TaxID=3110246 RepID=UPI002B22171B|nr:hypothetical protein [Crocosphaera sp. UHCC 0190]MEA5510495.1 hypothetical protein [Crocosphaera sp. UHCC 0190]